MNYVLAQLINMVRRFLTIKRFFLLLIVSFVLAWLSKDAFTLIFMAGKSYAGRSELIRISIIVILAILYFAFLICFYFGMVSLFHKQLNAFSIFLGGLDIYLMVVTIGFLVAYTFFFILPVFLGPAQRMLFMEYIPVMVPIGGDTRQVLDFVREWMNQQAFNAKNVYPPLVTMLMAPFVYNSPESVYKVITYINLVSYFVISFFLPLKLTKQYDMQNVVYLLFFSGLFSYGFHFEIERGQFNVIAILLVFLAIYLFHNHKKLRYLSYIFFSLGVQLKVYPAIFVLFLVDDWREWIKNLKRFSLLGLFNLLLLFLLGYQQFVNFVESITNIQIGYVWIGNHSIKSFTSLLAQGFFASSFEKFIFSNYLRSIFQHEQIIRLGLFILVFLCFLVIFVITIKKNQTGFNSYLFVASTLVALVVPAISHDYTLSLLTGPMAIFLGFGYHEWGNSRYRWVYSGLIFIITCAYTSTLFSYTNKPLWLQSNLIPLLIILLGVTVLALLPNRQTFENLKA